MERRARTDLSAHAPAVWLVRVQPPAYARASGGGPYSCSAELNRESQLDLNLNTRRGRRASSFLRRSARIPGALAAPPICAVLRERGAGLVAALSLYFRLAAAGIAAVAARPQPLDAEANLVAMPPWRRRDRARRVHLVPRALIVSMGGGSHRVGVPCCASALLSFAGDGPVSTPRGFGRSRAERVCGRCPVGVSHATIRRRPSGHRVRRQNRAGSLTGRPATCCATVATWRSGWLRTGAAPGSRLPVV